MYCTHCTCPSCKALKATSGDYSKVREDVLRLIIKAGESGLTLSELDRASRPIRTLNAEQIALMMDQMVSSGIVVKHTFKPESGRGRSREAFLFVDSKS